MATESDLEKKCRRFAEKNGCRLVKIKTPGTKGFPDRLLISLGLVAFLEFKTPKGGGRTSPMQKRWQKELRKMGLPCHQIKSYDEFLVAWEELA